MTTSNCNILSSSSSLAIIFTMIFTCLFASAGCSRTMSFHLPVHFAFWALASPPLVNFELFLLPSCQETLLPVQGLPGLFHAVLMPGESSRVWLGADAFSLSTIQYASEITEHFYHPLDFSDEEEPDLFFTSHLIDI